MEWLEILKVCVPIFVALVGIIPTITSSQKKTQTDIANLQKTLDNHITEDENERARNQRYRILRFYDELCEGRHHSESHFEDILDDITNYRNYASTHPNFHNSRGEIAMEEIQETYRQIKHDGGFLVKAKGA